MDWSVGITTCERPMGADYLPATIESLRAAGWEPDTIQADIDRDGAWPTWLACLRSALDLSSGSGYLLILQDDVRFTPECRPWVERILETDRPEVASLYCSGGMLEVLHAAHRILHRFGLWIPPAGWPQDELAGALAMVLSVDAARRIAETEGSGKLPKGKSHHADRMIGLACDRLGTRILFHAPSLAEHVGVESAVFPEMGPVLVESPMRRAGRFATSLQPELPMDHCNGTDYRPIDTGR